MFYDTKHTCNQYCTNNIFVISIYGRTDGIMMDKIRHTSGGGLADWPSLLLKPGVPPECLVRG